MRRTESANAHSFLTELCALLELPRPDPALKETEDNPDVFERKVTFHHQDGSETYGFIDCHRRDCFVLEASQTGKAVESQSWGSAMRKAHGQAQSYLLVAAPGKNKWPKALAEQVQAVRSALAEQPGPATPEIVARTFKRAQTRRVAELLETLTALSQARAMEDRRYAA